jgi:hypothetical protein
VNETPTQHLEPVEPTLEAVVVPPTHYQLQPKSAGSPLQSVVPASTTTSALPLPSPELPRAEQPSTAALAEPSQPGQQSAFGSEQFVVSSPPNHLATVPPTLIPSDDIEQHQHPQQRTTTGHGQSTPQVQAHTLPPDPPDTSELLRPRQLSWETPRPKKVTRLHKVIPGGPANHLGHYHLAASSSDVRNPTSTSTTSTTTTTSQAAESSRFQVALVAFVYINNKVACDRLPIVASL